MSTQDGRFADGPAGPVRVADFDALDDADVESTDEEPVRVASFDADDAPADVRSVDLDGVSETPPSEETGGARVATFDEPDETGPDDSVRIAEFGRSDDAGQVPPGGRSRAPGRGGRDHRATAPPDGAGGRSRRREIGDEGGGSDGTPGTDRDAAGDERGARGGRAGRRGRTGGRTETGPPPDPEARAKEICLRLLTDRARTVKELRDALHRKEIPDDVADRVLERFDEVGLVDDEAFAGQWVRSRHNHRGLGRRAIAQELHRKGVEKEIADTALAEIDAESEQAKARELVGKKMRTVRVGTREERAAASRRLVGMLARKGYGAGVAYAVVREAIAARGAEEDELGDEPADD